MKLNKYNIDTTNYIDKVDVDYAYNVSCNLLSYKTNEQLGYRTAGSFAEHQAADYLINEMNNIGLANVRKEEFLLDSWTFEKAELKFRDLENNELSTLLGTYQINFDTNGEKEYSIVYAGRGTKQDYKNIDVANKLVLIDIDQRNEWWVNYPALQAKHKGAAAVIAIQYAGFSEVNEDALNANDIIGPHDAPIFSISKRYGEILKDILLKNNNEIKVTLDAKTEVEFNKSAYNVTGEIEGKDKNSYIIFSSHYDAYFDGFQDNATAVGIMYGIAKAFIDSGYKPNRTLVFTSLAAEEWGTSNSRYDWSTGAYNEIFKINKHWQGNAILNINFELPAVLHNPFDEITAVNELEEYLVDFVNTVPKVENAYSEDTKVITPLTTWADDWSFSIGGVPAVRNDFTSSDFRITHYHTNFDDISTYNENVFLQHHILYGLLAIHSDYLAVAPLNFNTMLKKLEQSLISVDNDKTNNILQTISKLKLKFDKVNERIKESNNKFYSLKNENEQLADQFYEKQISFEKHILKIFRYVQDKFLKLNWEDEPIFPHEELLKNISNLKLAISGLRNNEDKDKILEYLFAVDNNFLANYFDKYVWDYFNDYVLKAPKEKLMWGEGRIVSHVDLYEIIEMLNEQENTKSIITKLESKLLDQENILNNVLENEFEDLNGLLNLVFEL